MVFTETSIPGVIILDPSRIEDERGFFARSFDAAEFRARGMNPDVVQCNISFNKRRGTVRGMHYQAAPHEESKLVRCTQGEIFDVALDLREGSATFGKWTGVRLSAENRRALYLPEGIAHGFQTLADNTEIFYQMGRAFEPTAARGVRWDDPAFDVQWPEEITCLAPKDEAFPLWPNARR
jgi:dTDP-4-dehydrorhamnose 3,5-epimerase